MRSSSSWTTLLEGVALGAVDGSSTMVPTTWECADGVSMYRNEASIPDRRFIGTPSIRVKFYVGATAPAFEPMPAVRRHWRMLVAVEAVREPHERDARSPGRPTRSDRRRRRGRTPAARRCDRSRASPAWPSSPATTIDRARLAGTPVCGSGKRVADVPGGVGEHRRIPQPARVVQQRLVEAGEVGRRRDGAAPGHAGLDGLGPRELHERLVGDLAEVEAGDAEHGLPLRRRRRLADEHRAGELGLLGSGDAEPEGVETERIEHPATDGGAEVLAVDALEQLGQHPVRRGRVVLEPRPGLPVEAPLREGLEARVAVGPATRCHGCVREAGRVQQHLLDGDDVLAVRARTRGRVRRRGRTSRSEPSARSCQMADATTALVHE